MSQQANVDAMATLTGLTHDVFKGSVENNVRRRSPASMLYQEAEQGEYSLEGQNMVFFADFHFSTGAMATSGWVPDYQGMDAVQGKISPTRRYARVALDNLIELQASGEGSAEDITDRIFDQLWDKWESMEIRHSIGYSSALIGVVESRTSSTKFILADGYGNSGTSPITHLSKNSIIAWWDLTATAAIDGAAKVDDIDYETREVTIDDAATWEPSQQLDVGDLIYFATTPNISRDYFEAERNLAPNGLGTIVDPTGSLTTVHNISETDNGRSKPYRKVSVTHDHIELTEFWRKLGIHRGFPVSPETDCQIAFPSVVDQIARSLMSLQQQAYTGDVLQGGWKGVKVSGMDIIEDPFFYHDVSMTVCKDKLKRVVLGGEPDFFSGDGSMWQRISDYDGKDGFVGHYMQQFSPFRGAHGALTGIETDLEDDDYLPIPNY
ncbi:MAG: hypothetical protein AB7Q29_16030 [Vicinamibacterales bacterium]